jgi:hypothetical protein
VLLLLLLRAGVLQQSSHEAGTLNVAHAADEALIVGMCGSGSSIADWPAIVVPLQHMGAGAPHNDRAGTLS